MYSIIHYLDENERDIYQSWLNALRDRTAKIALIRRVARLELGLFGDCKSLQGGVSELRVDVGQVIAFITRKWAIKLFC